jgi:hypothetical protein
MHTYKPAVQKIVIQLLHQLAFGPNAVEYLQQQRAQQLLTAFARPPARSSMSGAMIDAVIETALAHQDEDEVRRIYNRALYLPERKKLMQDWADLMDDSKKQMLARRAA